MAQTIEISLKVPSLRVKREGKDAPETISNGDVRFVKRIEVDSIPKTGTVLVMEIASHGSFESVVVRSDWHEDKSLFVVACQFRNQKGCTEDNKIDRDDSGGAPQVKRLEKPGLRMPAQNNRTHKEAGEYEEEINAKPSEQQSRNAVLNFSSIVRRNNQSATSPRSPSSSGMRFTPGETCGVITGNSHHH